MGAPLAPIVQLICHKCGHRPEPDATFGTRCLKDGSALVFEEDHRKAPRDGILGRVIAGKYPVIGIIGSGGMGSVYRALQEPVGREVALKVIRNFGDEASEGVSETLRARFFREAKVVAKMANPSAVTLYDYGVEDDGVLYMVLEYVKGLRLSDVIRAEGVLSPARAVDIASGVLYALAEAHSLGLVHRDLKPDNIMLVRGPWGEEQAKVLDFGIAKVRSKEKETLETGTGLLLGTPLYMPPEQAMSRGAEPRSDLYSLGVVLFEMLLGTPPFAANTVFEVLLAHREKPIPAFPPEYAIPPALEAVVVRAMAKEPEQRFADAAEMAHALRDAVPMGTGSEANQPGTSPGARMPMSPSMMAMRTPLPGAVRQSGPGLLNAAVQAPSGQTPLPPGVRRSGVVDPAAVAAASQAGLDRTSMRGSRPGLQPLSQSPEFAATHAQAGSSDPLSLPAETAGTMLRATPRPVVPAKTSPHAVQGSGQGPSVIVASDPNLEAPRRARTGLGLVVGLVGLLVLGGGGAGAWWFLKSRGDDAVINGVKGIPIADPTPGPQPIKPPPPPEAPSSPARPEEPVKRPPAEQQVAAAGPDASVEGVATNVEPPAKAPLPDSASPAQQPATKLPGLAKPNRPARPTVGATRPGRGDAAKPGAGTKVKEGGYEVTSF